jgi:hypothetical protein
MQNSLKYYFRRFIVNKLIEEPKKRRAQLKILNRNLHLNEKKIYGVIYTESMENGFKEKSRLVFVKSRNVGGRKHWKLRAAA